MIINDKEFDTENRAYIMGILNFTPDSFSDGGKYNNIQLALKHVQEMIEGGADFIDVGGESTRPGYVMISEQEEIERIVPVIEQIKKNFDIPVSADTYKSQVAKSAIMAGADMINDIWGLRYDEKMAEVIAKNKVSCCLMHNRNLSENPYQKDIMSELMMDLKKSIDIALSAGISKERIMIDPGIGFAKSLEENLKVMNHLEMLKELGFPILLGTSRKSMIGLSLNLPSDERLEGTIATTVIGMMKGCSFFRVHDVKENKRAVLMTRAIISQVL